MLNPFNEVGFMNSLVNRMLLPAKKTEQVAVEETDNDMFDIDMYASTQNI